MYELEQTTKSATKLPSAADINPLSELGEWWYHPQITTEQRLHYLAAMEIPVWLARSDTNVLTLSSPMPLVDAHIATFTDVFATANSVATPTSGDAPPPLMYVPQPVPEPLAVVTKPQPSSISIASVPTVDWETLAQQVQQCQACSELVANRTRTVLGVGNRQAKLLIVGEAPGAEEDQQGEPFVGRAGQLLNAMLTAIGLQRPEIYIANILKCRPPNNRTPRPEEAQQCEPWLLQQIALINPACILAAGAVAAQNLLKTQTAVGRLRGQVHEYGPKRIPLVVTYHPSYLLRSPGQKAQAWKDLQVLVKVLRQIPNA